MPKDKGKEKDNNSILDFKRKNEYKSEYEFKSESEYESKSGSESKSDFVSSDFVSSDFVSKEDFIGSLDESILSKMIFLYNAVNDGWKIEKQNGLYIFRKKHNNKEEIYSDAYLENFITDNLRFSKLV